MAKQDNYVRTQIRINSGLYEWIKEFTEKNNVSLNEAMNSLIHDALYEKTFSEETNKNKESLIEIINARLEHLNVRELQSICDLVVRISQLKGF